MTNKPLPVRDTPTYGSCDPSDGKSVSVDFSRNLSPECQSVSAANCEDEQGWLHKAATRVPCFGIILALGSSFFLGSAGMLVKLTHSVHGVQVAFFRAAFQIIVYGLMIHFRRIGFHPKRGEFWSTFARALLGACSITCSYFALKLIPLGDATVIRFSLPIWTLIVSYLVLNESCSLMKILAVVISIMGVVLIAKPDSCVYFIHLMARTLGLEDEETFEIQAEYYASLTSVEGPEKPLNDPMVQLQGSMLALCSSVCLAMSMIAQRMCRKTSAEVCVFWLSTLIVGMGSMVLFSLGEFRIPDNWTDVLFILLNGVCGAVGQWLICNALKFEQSGVISLARTADIEVAFLYSAFLLKEDIRATSIVGAILVSFGVVSVVLSKLFKSTKQTPDQDQQVDQAQPKDPELGAKSAESNQPLNFRGLSQQSQRSPNRDLSK